MRYLYTFLLYLALPFIIVRLVWRSRRLKDYRRRIPERFGFYSFSLDKCIWVHAVSVGEVIAAIPLIKKIQAEAPNVRVLVTTMTPTGAERVNAAFGDTVSHVYIPYDLPFALQRFIKKMHPIICIIMETELWPNLLIACKKNNVPVALLNARLSQKSASGYERIKSFTQSMLTNISVIAAQGQSDADRFIALGCTEDKVIVTGSIKFDLQAPLDLSQRADALREKLGRDRFIWIAASTHDGEEEMLLRAHKAVLATHPDALLILVPRHPDRFDAVNQLCIAGFKTKRRSEAASVDQATQVYLADTMGEMLLLYAASDVAFVAGSFIPRGGHNILEPAVLAKPILSGPHVFNFQEICDLFSRRSALTFVTDEIGLAKELNHLIGDSALRATLGNSAKQVMDENRGALSKQFELIRKQLV